MYVDIRILQMGMWSSRKRSVPPLLIPLWLEHRYFG